MNHITHHFCTLMSAIVICVVCTFVLTGCGMNDAANSASLSTESTESAQQSMESNSTMSAPSASTALDFKIVDANYNQYDGTYGLDEQQRIQSSVILSLDQLNSNTIPASIDYSPDFFNENALIFISVLFSNTASDPPTIDKVYYEGNKIQIDAKRGPADDESIEWWCCFLEVSKSGIDGADESTAVNVNVDGKLPIIE